MHKTLMDKLEVLARPHLKKWLSIQKHGVTNTVIFYLYMIGTQAPSQLYIEAHAGIYAMIWIKRDPLVKHALDSQLKQ